MAVHGLPALLKRYRAQQGWTQQAAADATGVPVSTWRGWEAGKPMPQPGLIGRLLLVALEGGDHSQRATRTAAPTRT